jgi:hypothetical protein
MPIGCLLKCRLLLRDTGPATAPAVGYQPPSLAATKISRAICEFADEGRICFAPLALAAVVEWVDES